MYRISKLLIEFTILVCDNTTELLVSRTIPLGLKYSASLACRADKRSQSGSPAGHTQMSRMVIVQHGLIEEFIIEVNGHLVALRWEKRRAL